MVIIPGGNPAYQNEQNNHLTPTPGWYILESRRTFKPVVGSTEMLQAGQDQRQSVCTHRSRKSCKLSGWIQGNSFTAQQLWAEGGGSVSLPKTDQQSQELSKAFLCVQVMLTEPFCTSNPRIHWWHPIFYVRKWLTQLCRNFSQMNEDLKQWNTFPLIFRRSTMSENVSSVKVI